MERRARGRGARAGRAGLPSRVEERILALLAEHGDLYGLQLVALSEGALKRGTVYVTLGRMEAKGMVESYPEQREEPTPGIPRRLYHPTRAGLAALRDAELAAAVAASAEFQS